MSRVLFTGYYGFENMGDDAFVRICDWGARNIWNIEEYAFLPPTGIVEKSINRFSSNLRYKGKYALESLYYGYKSDYLVFGGGSLFFREIQKFSAYDIYRMLCKFKITKVGAIGVSIGPFTNKKAYGEWKSFLKDFDFIAVRDRNSFEVTQEMNLNNAVLAYDLAALLPEIFKHDKISSNNVRTKTIGISICSDNHSGISSNRNEHRINRMIEVLNVVHKQTDDVNFKFFIINKNKKYGDSEITKSLISCLNFDQKRYSIVEYTSVDEMWYLIKSCNLILSCRLHCGLFAAFSNTPFLQIEYHPKCKNLLDDLGYPSNFRIGDMDISCKETVQLIFELLGGSSNFNLAKKDYCIDSSMKNFSFPKIKM